MLDGITFYTDDIVWAGILSDLGAVAADVNHADLAFKSSDKAMTVPELKSYVLQEIDRQQREILNKIFARDVKLSPMQAKIVIALWRAGATGLGADDLRNIMGYSTGANTHTTDTAIYTLRKMFGTEFIVNDKGMYKLGTV